MPSPKTNRLHCIAFSDWSSQPKVELANGMRMDTNYYYWPGSWIQNRPGFMTGSGMPMRFADTDGSMIDIYQAMTQMTDESDQAYPFTPNTLLDNALGPHGYYGAFTANMHTDSATIPQNDALIASAKARGVPIVSGKQMLDWIDGRNGSSVRLDQLELQHSQLHRWSGNRGQRSYRHAADRRPEWHPAEHDYPRRQRRGLHHEHRSRVLTTPCSMRPAAATLRRTPPLPH